MRMREKKAHAGTLHECLVPRILRMRADMPYDTYESFAPMSIQYKTIHELKMTQVNCTTSWPG